MDNLSASWNRRQLEFNRDKCKILNYGAEPSAGQESKWKGHGWMTKRGRTRHTPRIFLQKYTSLADSAEKKRQEAAELHSQGGLLGPPGGCSEPSSGRRPAGKRQGSSAGDGKLPVWDCYEDSILLFLCQAPNTRRKRSNDNLRRCL